MKATKCWTCTHKISQDRTQTPPYSQDRTQTQKQTYTKAGPPAKKGTKLRVKVAIKLENRRNLHIFISFIFTNCSIYYQKNNGLRPLKGLSDIIIWKFKLKFIIQVIDFFLILV